MPYRVGAKGSYGCSGYPAVKEDGTVMGCHQTRAQAAGQIYAINRSEGKIGKSMVKEGDMVMAGHDDEIHVGRVVHVMKDGMLGFPGSEYSIVASAEDPAILMQLFEMEEGGLEETEYFMGHKASEVMPMPSLESNVGMDKAYEGCGCPTCKELNVNCENCPVCKAKDMSKSEDYESDNEEEDKWDNMTKACWVGYEQRGMKEKDGRMVPNCVPVNKAQMANAPYQDAELDREDSAEIEMAAKPNYEDMIKPRRSGSTPANPRLYAAVVQAAKDKFDVYPSAVANGWVVQEYKRRGGTYKGVDMDKREFSGGQRERMAESGTAMPDGSFPIASRADLMNAIRSVGRAKDYGAARAHIIRRARALNAMEMLPEDWRNKATKGMGQWSGSIFDLNPFVK